MPNSELPHAVDAERAILGALLMNNNLFADVEGTLKTEFFYDKRHRIIFQAMEEMQASGYVDPVTLSKRLADSAALAEAGGKEYIADIAAIGAAPMNMKAYIEQIRNAAVIRKMIQSMNEGISEAYHPGNKEPRKLLDEVEARLSEISENFARGEGNIQEAKEVANKYFDKISKVVKTKDYDSLLGAPTGIPRLDTLTSGLHRGDLIILAGRPGTGKTAFGLHLMRHISAAPGVGIICLSLEMSAEQLVMRMLSQDKIDMHKLRVGRGLTSEDLSKLAGSVSTLESRDIHIDDSGMINILEARARARRLKREMNRKGNKLGLIFVDYLQLMDAGSGSVIDSRVQEVANISRGLKALAKELDTPVLAASQLNRSIETRQNKQPMLSDLRESGAIEQDADLILFLHRKENAPPFGDGEDSQTVQLTIGKQRNGPVGSVDLAFDGKYSRFQELSKSPEPGEFAPPDEF